MTATPPPLSHTVRLTVRFKESDLLGIVWHGNYVTYLEDARQALGVQIGLSYEDFMRQRFAAPIVDLRLQYKRPAKYGDKLDVTASLVWQEVPKFVHRYEIRRSSDSELLTTAETTQVLLHPDGSLALNFPPFVEAVRERWRRNEIKVAGKTETSPFG
ncbi:MAG: acyl-CoA thioesterase [Planctomycetes bacterium]|nr:acyl-CoA thioesterase [Planctomycetota bacterium]